MRAGYERAAVKGHTIFRSIKQDIAQPASVSYTVMVIMAAAILICAISVRLGRVP